MATRITLNHMGESAEKAAQTFVVEEEFDEVLENVAPTRPPTSQLEHRQNFVYHKQGTRRRVFIPPPHIACFEEDWEEDE